MPLSLVVVDERGGVDETLHVPFTQFVVDEIFTGRERGRERKREREKERQRESVLHHTSTTQSTTHAYKTY